MKYLSLFSGIEAASVAWEPLGWEAVAFAEFERFPSDVLDARFPDVPNLGDVTAVDWESFAAEQPEIDILIGGSPCQAFSVAGLRRSMQDERGNLTLEYVRIADAVQPRVLVWENVPGALSTDDNAFGCLLGAVVGHDSALLPGPLGKWASCGVAVGPRRRAAWRVLDAQYFGVAQRRRRVFLVACPVGGADPASILLEPDCVSGHPPARRGSGEVAAALTAGGVGTCGADDNQAQAGHLRAVCVTGDVAHALTAEGHDASEDGTGRGTPIVLASGQANAEVVEDGVPSLTCLHEAPIVMAPSFSKRPGQQIATRQDDACYALTTGEPPRVLSLNARQNPTVTDDIGLTLDTSGYSQAIAFSAGNSADSRSVAVSVEHTPLLRASESGTNQVPTVLAIHENGRGEVTMSDTAGALSTGGGKPGQGYQAVIDGYAVRRLMPVECARLQGFPDGWTDVRGKTADTPQYKALGNSMAVPVIAWLGERIEAVLEDRPVRYGTPERYRDEIEGREEELRGARDDT